jgi:2-polyprenyl-6-methoxyphenol hydroxylase-like FAD-dependent oxidoreductase
MTLATISRYDSNQIANQGGHAVVIGAGMAGLLAARVLTDAFDEITVIDRDPLPDDPVSRRGVPQGNQPHVLLESGRATLEDLFPGFSEDLRSAGGVTIEFGADLKVYLQGDFIAAGPNRHEMILATRPLLEHLVRQRVFTLDRVHIHTPCQFVEYLTNDATTIGGVVLRDQKSKREELKANLVVDATSRTSRTPAWLKEHGYTPPALDEIRIDLGYGSTFIERPPNDTRAFSVEAEAPHTRGAFVFPVEGDRWHVNLHGVHGDHPPADTESFREFAASLPTPVVKDLLDKHPIVSEGIIRYPFASSRRYRYEDLDQFPEGLIVIGDAIASYNPVNGQGMSVAALQALTLHHALATDDRKELAFQFFDRAAEVVNIAWDLSTGGDLAFPQTEGPRPRGTAILDWYLERLYRRAHTDGQLSDTLWVVFTLQQPPSILFRPQVIWRVLGLTRRGRRPQPGESRRSRAT